MDEIGYLLQNFDDYTAEVWERVNNFISHFVMDVITYPSWD